MKAVPSFKIAGNTNPKTQHHVPESLNLHVNLVLSAFHNANCNTLFACTYLILGFLTFSIYTQKSFACCYLRNADASTFLFTCATWCIWHGLVTCIKRTLYSNCLISLLHNHRVLLNYHVVHVPSAALCRSDTWWNSLKVMYQNMLL